MKRLSAYWWCQIGGWGLFLLLCTFFYFAAPGFATFESYSDPIVVAVVGFVTSHLMRLFIIKTKLLSLKIWKQFIYLLLTTILFSLVYLVFEVVPTALQGHRGYRPRESFLGNLSAAVFINSQFLGIWNLIYFAVHYIQKSRNEQIAKIRLENELLVQKLESEKIKAELKQRATELEMQALRAQMNPHFIFNSLNSIHRFILQNNRAQASSFLTKFSKLVRMILNSSAKTSVSLGEDLEALQLYLELESLRFEKKFCYKIDCDPEIDVDFIQVPPMLLQPFVENAIWHGLMSKEGDGRLWINIAREDTALLCTIMDDGIGRKKAAELEDRSGKHKSMGMKITENRIAMMQKMNEGNKSVEIRDLVDSDGNAAGTEVTLRIPIA